MKAYAHESITVEGTAIGLTAATINLANSLYGRPVEKVKITCETAQVRFTTDGTTPTSTVGHIMEIGDVLELESEADARGFQAIRTGSSGTLKATFEV